MSGFRNRVKFATSTTGTGSVTAGSASSGFQLPAAAGMLDGETAEYVIEDGTDWEAGKTTASSSATVFSRELEQSSTGSLLNLSGSATMYLTPTAATMNRLPSMGQILATGIGAVLS